MAIFMNETVTVTVNSVDLTDHITSVDFSESAAEIETTAMGDATVTRIAGLKDASTNAVIISAVLALSSSLSYVKLYLFKLGSLKVLSKLVFDALSIIVSIVLFI